MSRSRSAHFSRRARRKLTDNARVFIGNKRLEVGVISEHHRSRSGLFLEVTDDAVYNTKRRWGLNAALTTFHASVAEQHTATDKYLRSSDRRSPRSPLRP